MKAQTEYPDQVRLTTDELRKLQERIPIVVTFQSPVDIMIGQYNTVELLVLPPKEK